MTFERKSRPSGLPTEVIRSKPAGASSPKPSNRKEVSLLTRVRKFFGAAITAAITGVVFADPAAAADNTGCRTQWATAFKPVVDNVTGNAKGIFLILAIPLVIIALVGLGAGLHSTRHRGSLVAVFGFVLLAAIGIAVAPTIVNSFTSGVCS